jgi:Bacterial Ig domain
MTHPLPRRTALAALALLAALGCNNGDTPPLGPSENRAPEIRSITLTPAVVPPRGSAVLRVDASDPDGDRLFYHFTAQAGTVTADPSTPGQATYVHTGAGEGADRVTVTVTDSRNASATLSRTVPLQGNRGPQVVIQGKEQCHPPCSVTLTAVAADADQDTLDYVWSGCASGHDIIATCSLSAPGDAVAAATVSDGQGGLTTAVFTVRGTNHTPTIQGRQDAPQGEPRLLVFENDLDGDRMVCGWWGDCLCTGSNQSFNLICNVPSGVSSCFQRFACTDPYGASGEYTFTLRR